MKRFQRILVPIDVAAEQDPALDRAAELAKEHGAAVKLVDVIEEVPFSADLLMIEDAVIKARKRHIETLAQPLRNGGIDVTTEVLKGSPAYEVTRQVLQNNHDLVLRTSRTEGFIQRLFFGTMAMRLMRICPCPLWVVQPKHDRPFQRIVAAVDPLPGDSDQTSLNLKILDLAHALAQWEGSELHVVHAWYVYGEGVAERHAIAVDFGDFISQARVEAELALEGLIEESGIAIPRQRLHLMKGPAAEVIPRLIHDEDIELLVMGTVARAGIPGFLIGNTAERILHQIDCSLLAVKPDGFVSPVAQSF